MFSRVIVSLFILIFLSLESRCQEREVDLNSIISDNIVDEEDTDEELSERIEQLEALRRRRLDLNKADRADLDQLYFLSSFQIEQFLYHREKVGAFTSVYELQGISGFDLGTIQAVLPFVKVSDALTPEFAMMVKEGTGYVTGSYFRQLEEKRGFKIDEPSRSRYLGTADKFRLRLRQEYRKQYYLTFNAAKDAGEPFFKLAQRYGFDYNSGSLLIKDNGIFKRIIVGDYHIQFGQGLAIWTGGQFGRGNPVLQVANIGAGIRQHSGMRESGFLRGMAFTAEKGRFKFTPYVAFNELTGTLRFKGDTLVVSSINGSGLHRTPSEQRNRKTVKQWLYGLNSEYEMKSLRLGLNYLSTHFKDYFSPAERNYNAYRFRGTQLQQTGAYAHFTWRNVFTFGESAHSFNSGWAHAYGAIASLSPKLSTSIAYRNYQRDYHQFYAQGYGRLSSLGNEEGIYLGLLYHPSRSWEWATSFDVHRFP